ncbi:tetratricopeptide repeat protein [Hugenholtzia roseola]|uniref:tetratricopeptide repeat protein n=1 Tax=Hugenholtzia roseola TaxID=1002 RepID=UPI00041CD4D8|nr:tetratricopeptide repeat protein [Hugenholtzia roseola]
MSVGYPDKWAKEAIEQKNASFWENKNGYYYSKPISSLFNMMLSKFRDFSFLGFFLFSILSFSFFWVGFSPTPLVAQQADDVVLAEEYFKNGENEKALSLYEKLAKQPITWNQIHSNYMALLARMELWADAEKYMNKRLKSDPNSPTLNVEYADLLQRMGKKKEADKHLETYLNTVKGNRNLIRYAANVLTNSGLYEQAERLYLEGRKEIGENYYLELGLVYGFWGKSEKMTRSYLDYLLESPQQVEYVQRLLASRFSDEESWQTVEPIFYEYVQKNADKTVFNEMLLWYFLQKNNFSQAFLQAKALDKRLRLGGMKVFEIGNLAYANQDYAVAQKVFEYLVQNYQNTAIYGRAKQQLIKTKEEIVRNTFPVDLVQIQSLVADYESTIAELGWSVFTTTSARNVALLRAFYLDQKSEAIQILTRVIETKGLPARDLAQAKLDLGDIYLLKNEPWESTLLYSQVEKAEKETPLGHLAKLKNAKLSFYKGEFELAKEHLNVLKLATSREIANDAMQLAILIQDNLGLDTTDIPLRRFAEADLLLFQSQYQAALDAYDALMKDYPNHSLEDEILLAKAQIFIKMGNPQQAASELETLLKLHSDDIYADDALFLAATLYEEKLALPQKAQEYYKRIFVEYAGSVFVAEARKRFRNLRGDKI